MRVRHQKCHIEPRAFRDCVTWPRARSRKHAFRGSSRDDFCAKQLGMPDRNSYARRWRQQCPVRSDAFGPGLSSTLHAKHLGHGSLFLSPRPLIQQRSQYVSVRGPAGRPGTVTMSKLGFRELHAHAEQAVTKESDRALRRGGAAAVPSQSSPGGHGRSGWWPEQAQA